LERKRRKKIVVKKYFYLTGMLVLASMIIISCTKVGAAEEENLNTIDENDNVFPVITVLKPIVNQVYTSGDSIIVEGKVVDDKKMYKGKVEIKNDANNFVMADGYYETHFLSTINYRLAYKAVVTVSTDFSILVEFQDHGTNTSTTTIKVKVNP
jgi:hypothetical protein